jgi:hypothetical protein
MRRPLSGFFRTCTHTNLLFPPSTVDYRSNARMVQTRSQNFCSLPLNSTHVRSPPARPAAAAASPNPSASPHPRCPRPRRVTATSSMSRPDQRRPHHAGPPHPSRLCFSLPSPKICHDAAHSPPATAAMVYVDSWMSWWSGPCSSSVLTPSPANSIHSYPLLSCFVLDSWDEFVEQPRMQQHVRSLGHC